MAQKKYHTQISLAEVMSFEKGKVEMFGVNVESLIRMTPMVPTL